MINYLNLDSSILYRCNQKYFDKLLSEYDLGYTHSILLTQIYENEGLSMNELASEGVFDKGTITKSIQHLADLGYLDIKLSEVDKRVKLLYTTALAQDLMPKLYKWRKEWFSYLSKDLSEEELSVYNEAINKLNRNAREYAKVNFEKEKLKLYGLQKLTLLDFPGKMASTVFTGGCNFRCPFCHNRSLVFLNENDGEIDSDEVLQYLQTRTKLLDGIAITGGEPTLHEGLKDFIIKVRQLGLKVKLDTNGSNFERLRELVEEGLLDYVAMDIKNSVEKYAMTIGLASYDLCQIEKSKDYLLENHVDYEFRTTVVKGFHELEDFKKIGAWIKGAKNYYLQNFEDHGYCIEEGLSAVDYEELKAFAKLMEDYVEHVEIRGIKE